MAYCSRHRRTFAILSSWVVIAQRVSNNCTSNPPSNHTAEDDASVTAIAWDGKKLTVQTNASHPLLPNSLFDIIRDTLFHSTRVVPYLFLDIVFGLLFSLGCDRWVRASHTLSHFLRFLFIVSSSKSPVINTVGLGAPFISPALRSRS